jgi:hypothetical protein
MMDIKLFPFITQNYSHGGDYIHTKHVEAF